MRRLKLTLILLTLLAIGFAAKADVPCSTALDRCTMRADTLDSLNAVLKAKVGVQAETIADLQHEVKQSGTEYTGWMFAKDLSLYLLWAFFGVLGFGLIGMGLFILSMI